jgi:hypothetical protein
MDAQKNFSGAESKESAEKSHLTLFSSLYSFRIRSVSIFEEDFPTKIFDIFFLHDDMKLKEFMLFENIWRETAVLNHLYQRDQ